MNRTMRSRRLPVLSDGPGRIVVVTAFSDPERGMVRCGAASLMKAVLAEEQARSRGAVAVEYGPARSAGDREAPVANGVMFAVSWLDRAGVATGFGLIAHRDDRAGLAIAERVVGRWSKLVRSRRLLVAHTVPLCWGGRRAVRMIEDSVRSGPGPVYVVGRPVASRATLTRLAESGVRIVDELDRVPADARVVFPAHGVSVAVRAEAAARGLTTVDGTCPLVAEVHADAAHQAGRGDTVMVIGRPGHAALPVLADRAGETATVVPAATDVATLNEPDEGRVSFVIDPAMPVEDGMAVLAALRERFPRLSGHHFDVLCDAASDRVETIGAVAAASELMLVVTGTEDDHRAAHRGGATVRTVSRLVDLDPDDLANVTTVGLTTGQSAPPGLADQVIRALSGLGPLSVLHRAIRTRPDRWHEDDDLDRLGAQAMPGRPPGMVSAVAGPGQ